MRDIYINSNLNPLQNSLAPAEDLAAAEDLEEADLDIKYFFSETLPDYFQNTNNKDYSILHLNI